MKHSVKQIAVFAANSLSDKNTAQMAKTVWIELQRNKKFSQLDNLMDQIRTEFCHKNKLKKAEIITSREISDDEKQEIIRRTEKRAGHNILPIWRVDKNVLGGIKIKVEDELFDFSWRGKLELIRARLEG